MNLANILALLLQDPKKIEETAISLINMFKATTAPVVVAVPSTPAQGDLPAIPSVEKKPSDAIKELQTMLNMVLKPQPPLVVDGWLGAKTERAIHDGLAMLKPYLAMLG